ncbi:hypothetical protein GCM10009780_22900 [Actinomadura alba]
MVMPESRPFTPTSLGRGPYSRGFSRRTAVRAAQGVNVSRKPFTRSWEVFQSAAGSATNTA